MDTFFLFAIVMLGILFFVVKVLINDLQDGWANYAEISNKNAPKIKELVETIDDMDENKKKRL